MSPVGTTLRTRLGDITEVEVDAIVNAANSSLMGGGGVDGAIHRAGGPAILEECKEIVARQGPLPTGRAVITGAGRLPARHVIHTVGPIWGEVDRDTAVSLLASCYTQSLDLAAANQCRSVAFPCISTGAYGFPSELAAVTALGAVRGWVDSNPGRVDEVIFVCFGRDDYLLYEEGLAE